MSKKRVVEIKSAVERADELLSAKDLSSYSDLLHSARALLGLATWYVPPSALEAQRELERCRKLMAKTALVDSEAA